VGRFCPARQRDAADMAAKCFGMNDGWNAIIWSAFSGNCAADVLLHLALVSKRLL
jgi:hypothetical protein